MKHVKAVMCFKCGLKFGPAHRCPPKTLNVLVGETETDSNDEWEQPDDPLTDETGLEDSAAVQLM